jgi:acetoin utilization protein AcuB
MRVDELMSAPPITISSRACLDEALDLMDAHGIRHLPLIEDACLVGLVTDRDLLSSTGWLPERIRRVYQEPEARSQVVKDIAKCPAMTARPQDEALSLLIFEAVAQGAGGLPVVDATGAVIGVLTEVDLLRALVKRGVREPDPEVRDCMTADPRTVVTSTTLGEAQELCRRWSVRHLPVLGKAGMIGMVSDRDLRRAQGSGHRPDYPVDELMSYPVRTIDACAPMSEAAARMVETHASALPVEHDGEIVGILTTLDMLDHAIDVERTSPALD